jgi:diacylglycerol O-acyltransferase
MSDGQGVMQLFDMVHGRQSAPTPGKPYGPVVVPVETTPMDIAASRAAVLVRSSPAGLARVTSGLARTVVHGVFQPRRLASAVAYGSSLARVASAGRAHPSPLLRHRGLSRRLRAMDVPLAAMQAAGRATGGTVNDVFLAGLLGGLGRYHHEHGEEIGDLPIALPVSLRSGGDDPGGNRFAAAKIAGPAAEADPAERVRIIHCRVAEARAEPALDFMGLAAPVVSRLPSLVLARAAHRLARAIDLQASNIPGLKRDSYLAGARIERMYVFGPVPGSAIMATLVSHGDTCCIGVAVDHAAVPDPDILIEKFEEGMAEVVALGRR